MGKEDLNMAYWNLKRRLGVTMHFSELIKLQVEKMEIIIITTYIALIQSCSKCFTKIKKNSYMFKIIRKKTSLKFTFKDT